MDWIFENWKAGTRSGNPRDLFRTIQNRSRGFPIAKHFNSAYHSLNYIMIYGMKQCSSSNISRQQHETKSIFKVGTLRPDALKINFIFLWLCLQHTLHIRALLNLAYILLTFWRWPLNLLIFENLCDFKTLISSLRRDSNLDRQRRKDK